MKVRWLTNIPTPYRNHRHRIMAEVMAARGFDYEVFYMSWTEPDRHWTFGPGDIDHPHRIFAGTHAMAGGMHLHFNPGMLAALHRDRPDVVVIGGWSMPTLLLSPLVTRGSIRLLAAESNPDSVRWKVGLPGWIRRVMVRNADGFVVPSLRSRDLLESIDPGVRHKPLLLMPNIVDEAVWREGVDAQRLDADRERDELGVHENEQLWVCPARLEWFKGLEEFLPILRGHQGFVLAIAGDGSLRDRIAGLVEREKLPVRLLGHCSEARVQRLYAAADLFVLPSLSDANPLSAIEAAAAALPQWLSVRCGNYDDVVVEEQNGWPFDPDDGSSNQNTLVRILSLRRDELAALGRRSRQRHAERFDSRTSVERVVDGMYMTLTAKGKR